MKTTAFLVFAGLVVVNIAYGESYTQNNVNRANAIIEAAVEAHGGQDRLAGLETLYVTHESVNYSVNQSRGTDAPWDKSETTGFDAINLGDSVFVTQATFDGGGFEGHNATIINAEDSFQIDYRAGTAAGVAEPDFANSSGPFIRVTPVLLVRTLQDRAANAFYLGETTVDGHEYEVIGFSMTVGPAISLYFDKDDHLLRRSARVFAGAGLVEYVFEDYETVAGISFNRSFKLFLNGDLNIERKNASFAVNEPLDEFMLVDSGLQRIPEIEPDPLTRQEVDDGVWLIGGAGTYAMFVDMGDYIFAAGGTAGIPDRIASLREVIGDKPIRFGMLTHHHFDHVVGVTAYESEGATVIAAAAHEKTARAAANNADNLKLQTVSDRMTIESDKRVVQVIDIGPTAHTEHLLVAYLPQEGLVFEADHFALPRVGPIPPAVTSTKTFAAALGRQDLRVNRILSAHSPRVASMDDLRAALEKELYQARR